MSQHIAFSDNYEDLSTDLGFQFKFRCEKCGNGYMSTFERNGAGVAGEALRAASTLFGGFLNQAANSSYNVQRMIGGPAHDAALRRAVNEIAPLFNQCSRCGEWSCKNVCWNAQTGLCVRCTPKAEQEVAAIESEGTFNQLRQKANDPTAIDLTSGVQLHSAVQAPHCSGCGTTLNPQQKFCPDCGTKRDVKAHCPGCNALIEGTPKFCPDCGTKLSA